jgi:hypothetical protein
MSAQPPFNPMSHRTLLTALAAGILLSGCATTSNEPRQIWRNDKGQDILALYVRSTSGSPFNADSVGEASISKDDQGFVSIQVPLTNNSPFRKTANVGWEWRRADGMVARSPLGNSLRAVNIAGRDTQLVRSVSSSPEPRVVTLTLHPPN